MNSTFKWEYELKIESTLKDLKNERKENHMILKSNFA